MADGGVSFFQSQVPDKYVPEKPKQEPTQVEVLQRKLLEMEENQKKSSAEAHKKISELTTSTSFLNQTIQDLMSRNLQTGAQPQEPSSEPTDWDAAWRQQFGATTSPQTKEDDDVKPEEIAQTVRQEFGKLYQEGEQAKVAYQQQEAALIEKFRNEEKDLHGYAEEVKELWRTVSMANPQLDLPSRYALVVDTAKRTFLKGKAPGAPSGQGGNGSPQHPSRQQPRGEGLQEQNFTGNWRGDLQAEADREAARRQSLSQGVGQRKAMQAQRMGLNMPT